MNNRRHLLVLRKWLLVFGALALATSGAAAQQNFASEAGPPFPPPAPGMLWIEPVFWQQGGRPVPPPGAGPRQAQRRRPAPPAALLERLKNLPPEERERVLENNRRFQQLPPARQEQLRERLRQLQELSPEQRELVEQRFAIFNNLTPRQQEKARRIYERWRQMPPERRRALLGEFRRLREMAPSDRQQRLESEELQSQFDSDERDVLQQLISL